MQVYVKGRGSQVNPANRFLKNSYEKVLDDLVTEEERVEELQGKSKTKYLEVFPKTILNKIESPDISAGWSMNPYQGCEHGCIYCYARGTHEYWGYSAGAEFEQNILVKKNAHELLREKLLRKNWQAESIVLSGNTDCYQPAEKKFQITRKCLEVFAGLKHPVGIITKNALIERDTDILEELASQNLVHVVLSLTTLDEDLKRIMEPRTSTAKRILQTVSNFADKKIPVHINVAPIIPALNDDTIFDVVKAVADAGALNAGFIVVRLNGHNGKIFEDWVRSNFPDRANKVLNQIKNMHGGQLNDSRFGKRMKGEGKFAELVNHQFMLARKLFLKGRQMPAYDYSQFERQKQNVLNPVNPQMSLF